MGKYDQDLVISPARYYNSGTYQCISKLNNGSYIMSDAELLVFCKFIEKIMCIVVRARL